MNPPHTDAAPEGPGIDKYLPAFAKPAGYPSRGKLIDFTSLRAMVWRQRFIVGSIIALALLAGLLFTLLATPMYQASASVRVSDQTAPLIEGQDIDEAYIPTNEVARYMQTLGGVIESRSMAFQVVDALNLDNNPVLLGNMLQAGQPAGMDDEAWASARRNAAAGAIQSALSLDIPFDTRIIGISVSLPDADLAARVANGYANEFLSDDIRRGLEANSFAREYLEDEIAETRVELQEAEVEAIEYLRRHQIIAQPLADSDSNGDQGSAATMSSANLITANQAYINARARRIEAEQRWRSVANIPALDLPEVQQNPSIQSLRTQKAQRAGVLAELRERYLDGHPSVQEAMREVNALDAEIAAAAGSIKRAIRNEFTIAQRQEAALSGERDRFSAETLDEQDRRVQFSILNREAEAVRAQLDSLLQRYAEISSAANLQSASVTILDEAAVPGAHFSPNMWANLFVALVLGSGIAIVLAVLRETIDDRVSAFDDLERRIGIPALGQTPFVSNEVEGDLDDPFSPISEAYSSIRATVDFSVPKGSKTLQFTSTQPGEGKTTTAIAVARCLAAIGKKTLLIDMDLRRPAVADRIGTGTSANGLLDLLLSRTTLEQALVTDDGNPHLHILPLHTTPENPVVLLSSAVVPELLAQLSSQYDRIIIDSSPVLGIADAPLLSRYVDAVVFVVEANRTHARQINSAIRRLEDFGVDVTGAILTKYRALDAGEYHSYQYKYYSYAKS